MKKNKRQKEGKKNAQNPTMSGRPNDLEARIAELDERLRQARVENEALKGRLNPSPSAARASTNTTTTTTTHLDAPVRSSTHNIGPTNATLRLSSPPQASSS